MGETLDFEQGRINRMAEERQIVRDTDAELAGKMIRMSDLIDRFKQIEDDPQSFFVVLDQFDAEKAELMDFIAARINLLKINRDGIAKLNAYLALLESQEASSTFLRRQNKKAVPAILSRFMEFWARVSVSEDGKIEEDE